MSNETPNNLFTLIKSLTKSEKRYFAIFSKRHILGSQNKYVLLFDALVAQEVEEEEALKAILVKNDYNSNFLSPDKNYLYKLVLRSLNEFYYEHNVSLTIKNNLISIEILFHKGLYKSALKIVKQTERLITQSESHENLLAELLLWKRKCSGYAQGLDKAQSVNTELAHHIENMNKTQQVVDVYYRTYAERIKDEKITPEEFSVRFSEMFKSELFSNENNIPSIQGKIFYNLCYAHYHYMCNDFESEHLYHRRIIEIINDSPIYQKENAMESVALYNRLLSQSKFQGHEVFYKDLEHLKNIDTSKSFSPLVIKQRILLHASINELEHLYVHQEYLKASLCIPNIIKEIEKYDFAVEPYFTIQLSYLYALIYLSIGNYNGALDCTNQIINNYSVEDNPKVYLRSQLLNVVVHFELRNYKLVEYLSKAIIKKTKTEQNIEQYEVLLLKNLAVLCRYGITPRPSTIQASFQKLFESLESIKLNNIQAQNTLENYKRWLLAKRQNKTMLDKINDNK